MIAASVCTGAGGGCATPGVNALRLFATNLLMASCDILEASAVSRVPFSDLIM
jgi:hypothetical protein